MEEKHEEADLAEHCLVLVTAGRKRWLTGAIRTRCDESVRAVMREFGATLDSVDGTTDCLIIRTLAPIGAAIDQMGETLKVRLNEYLYRSMERKMNQLYEGALCWSRAQISFDSFAIPERDVIAYVRLVSGGDESLAKNRFVSPVQW